MTQETFSYVKVGIWVLIAFGIFVFVFSIAKWLKKYKILQYIGASISKNIAKKNLIHKENLNKKLREEKANFNRVEYSMMDKVYLLIHQVGILDHLPPGFTELSVLICYILIILAGAVVVGIIYSFVVSLVLIPAVLIATRQICKMIINNRRVRLESELFLFINACQCSAATHTDIINIFEDVYDQMQQPLSQMLEDCVSEANYTSNKALALRHLKEGSSSVQFFSVINNLEVCSETSGDYGKVIENLRDTLRIYNASLEKKKALLRNARANGLIMGAMGVVIMFIANKFFDGFAAMLFSSTIGIMLLIFMIFIVIIGMTISVE